MIVIETKHPASPKVTSIWSKVKTRSLLYSIVLSFLILVLHITRMALSKEDFLAFMKQNQIEREKETQNLSTMVKEGVRDEVRQVVTSIVTKQNLLEEQQICLENEHSSLKNRVSFLESELASIKNNPPSSSNNSNFPLIPTASTAPIFAESSQETLSSDDSSDAIEWWLWG